MPDLRSGDANVQRVPAPDQEIRFCTTRDNARIAYTRIGSGPPILKSANWMTHLDLNRKSPVWRHWLTDLSDGHALLTYDGRGYGLSDREPPELSFDAMVGDLEAVADHARLDRFPIVGFCHGGAIAIAYAAKHPERVSALILCGAYARGAAKRDLAPRAREEADLLLKLIEVGWGQEQSAFRQVFASKAIPDASASEFDAFNELQRASASADTAAALARIFWNIDVVEAAPAVRCPTLVCHARGDAFVPFEEGRKLAGLIPGARFVPLESRSHELLETDPAWPVFVREVRAFLAEQGSAPSPGVKRLVESLTARERDILERVAEGLANDEIAKALHLSEKTVRNHVSAVFAKLEVSSRSRAIVLAREAGFGKGRRPA